MVTNNRQKPSRPVPVSLHPLKAEAVLGALFQIGDRDRRHVRPAIKAPTKRKPKKKKRSR
jgi:hypothetical protein